MRTAAATMVLAGIVVVVLLQAGSGDASSPEIEPTADVAVTPTELLTTTTTRAPFEYRVGLLHSPSTSNFWEFYGRNETSWNAYVLAPTKPSLYRIDPLNNDLDADLASALTPPDPTETASGNWEVAVPIRTDVEWSDGVAITAADLAFTYHTVRELDLRGSWARAFPDNLIDVIAVSDTELRLVFDERPGLADWPFAVGGAPMMPAHVWEGVVESAAKRSDLFSSVVEDVSGGALVIIETAPDKIVAAVDHQRIDSTVDTVVFEVFASEDEAADAMIEDHIDTILSPRGLRADVADRLATQPGIALTSSPANSVRYLGFNLDRFPMNELAFRQAVALLMDRTKAVADVTPGAEPAFSVLPEANARWFDVERQSALADVDAASLKKRLATALAGLEEAGYSWASPPRLSGGKLVPGEGLEVGGRPPAPLTILTPGDLYDPDRPEHTALIEGVIESLGFDVRPVVTDFDTVVDLAFSADPEATRQYDMYVLGWTLGSPAYPDYYGPLFASSGEANSTGYDSERFDNLWQAFADAGSPIEARSLLWKMENRIARDLPYLTLYHPEIVEAYRADDVGYQLEGVLGGIQGRGGGLADVVPVD